MAVQEATDRQQEIRQLFKEYKFFYQILGGGVLVLRHTDWLTAVRQ